MLRGCDAGALNGAATDAHDAGLRAQHRAAHRAAAAAEVHGARVRGVAERDARVLERAAVVQCRAVVAVRLRLVFDPLDTPSRICGEEPHRPDRGVLRYSDRAI